MKLLILALSAVLLFIVYSPDMQAVHMTEVFGIPLSVPIWLGGPFVGWALLYLTLPTANERDGAKK